MALKKNSNEIDSFIIVNIVESIIFCVKFSKAKSHRDRRATLRFGGGTISDSILGGGTISDSILGGGTISDSILGGDH